MNMIRKTPNASGAYPAPQTWHTETPPEGYAVIADSVDMADFYTHNGFVTLTIEQIEVGKTVSFDGDGNETSVPIYADTVTAYAPNAEAWEAWKASLPEPEPEQPTEEEDTSAMLIDHEYRLTLLELGLSEY
jgi:hypothetical protein